jgi:hypothetical protein
MRSGFGSATELSASSSLSQRHSSCRSRHGSANVIRGNCRAARLRYATPALRSGIHVPGHSFDLRISSELPHHDKDWKWARSAVVNVKIDEQWRIASGSSSSWFFVTPTGSMRDRSHRSLDQLRHLAAERYGQSDRLRSLARSDGRHVGIAKRPDPSNARRRGVRSGVASHHGTLLRRTRHYRVAPEPVLGASGRSAIERRCRRRGAGIRTFDRRLSRATRETRIPSTLLPST